MRNLRDHVFIDCGPVGLGGLGGHGHNDSLSFEAVLDGVHLATDCGAYLYTASYEERNRFRSTAYHNTPQIDGEEINRFIGPDYLWSFHYDAVPEVREWRPAAEQDLFCGTHRGYRRLKDPVTPVRTVVLDHGDHVLGVRDSFEGSGPHSIEVPLHLAPGVEPVEDGNGKLLLRARGREFALNWASASGWDLIIKAARVSPSYGCVTPARKLVWRHAGALPDALVVVIGPKGAAQGETLGAALGTS